MTPLDHMAGGSLGIPSTAVAFGTDIVVDLHAVPGACLLVAESK